MKYSPDTFPVGTKLLVKLPILPSFSSTETTLCEVEVLVYSPSKKFVKLSTDDCDGVWLPAENDNVLVEELPSGKGKKTKQVLKG